jgi:hypothetical protein
VNSSGDGFMQPSYEDPQGNVLTEEEQSLTKMNDSHRIPKKEDAKPAAQPENEDSSLSPEPDRRILNTQEHEADHVMNIILTHKTKLQLKSILSMQYLIILHSNNIFSQSSKDDFKAYKHLHGIDMQIHSIPKSPKQKAQEIELSDLHNEEFKIFALEYNISSTELNNELGHYVNTLQQHNEDFDPGINDMFLNNLDPTFYAMQMQNPNVLTHAQMKSQVDANKFIEAQRP